jgi:hypothetical protein
MCSLVTPELMHAQHQARFAGLALIGLNAEQEKAIALFDRIGNARRERLIMSKDEREYDYRQIIFYSDLKVIADGGSGYSLVGREIRRDSLKYLAQLVSDRSLGIDVIVVDDKEALPLKRLLRYYDSLSVFGSAFTLWGYRSGSVAWSERLSYIEPHRKILCELQARSMALTPHQTVKLIGDLSDRVM